MLLRKFVLASLHSLLLIILSPLSATIADDEFVIVQEGDLPLVISAPHGGALELPGAPVRTGENLKKGASSFFAGRDGGTEELALLVVQLLDEKLPGAPSCVISRVHRKYVDFNRPAEIGVEHDKARTLHDSYHLALRTSVNRIRERYGAGLLIDLHGQGSSAATVYRGTSHGLTVQGLRMRQGENAHAGELSLMGLLKQSGWTVHPDPFTGREQAGFSGGHIVRTYGSHKSDGIDAIQLELGADYRKASARNKTARELADAIIRFSQLYLPAALSSTPQ